MRVYAGIDPVTKRQLYLTEVVRAGPKQAKEAEQVRTRLLNQLDEKRNPKMRATVDQLIERYFAVLDVDVQTMRGYKSKYENHIKPLVGSVPLTHLDVEVLDSFYAQLRTCRKHCDGLPFVQHRTTRVHVCDEHRSAPCTPPRPTECRACRRACKPHVCAGLSDSSIRQIHWILSGALDRATVWKWISVNPAEHADKPSLPTPNPEPPSVEDVAQLITAAGEEDFLWGAFLYSKATTGSRRGEMCALHRNDREVRSTGTVLRVGRSIFVNNDGELEEKDTKTHQHRRVVLDPDTDAVLAAVDEFSVEEAAAVGVVLGPDAYVFSPDPDGRRPWHPDLVSKRFARLCGRLGIDTELKNLRHYSGTGLLAAGFELSVVAGRLGHAGGGTTTLRVYNARLTEARQRAAGVITPPMPRLLIARREGEQTSVTPLRAQDAPEPYQRIAADIRGAIDSGILAPDDLLPTETALAKRYGVAASTAHRAVAQLVADGVVTASRGRRARVADAGAGEIELAITERRP